MVIERPSRLAELAADQLRTLIFEGHIPPGTVIRQEELASRLGISRTPLRESLRLLELEGLLETSATGTSRVADLSGAAAEEIMQVREVIDGLVARLLAERGLSEGLREQLESMLSTMDQASAGEDKQGYLSVNADFHTTLLHSLRHHWLDQFASLVRLSSQATYLQPGSGGERLRHSALEHRRILEAIVAGDGAGAEELARGHVANASDHWVVRGEPGPRQAKR